MFTEGLANHSNQVLAGQNYTSGSKILDVGCGFGDSTIAIAKLIGNKGEAVDMDCAENFVAASRVDAADAGVKNISFFAADAAVDDLNGPYDEVLARAAMKNIRKALKPGGRFTQVVW